MQDSASTLNGFVILTNLIMIGIIIKLCIEIFKLYSKNKSIDEEEKSREKESD